MEVASVGSGLYPPSVISAIEQDSPVYPDSPLSSAASVPSSPESCSLERSIDNMIPDLKLPVMMQRKDSKLDREARKNRLRASYRFTSSNSQLDLEEKKSEDTSDEVVVEAGASSQLEAAKVVAAQDELSEESAAPVDEVNFVVPKQEQQQEGLSAGLLAFEDELIHNANDSPVRHQQQHAQLSLSVPASPHSTHSDTTASTQAPPPPPDATAACSSSPVMRGTATMIHITNSSNDVSSSSTSPDTASPGVSSARNHIDTVAAVSPARNLVGSNNSTTKKGPVPYVSRSMRVTPDMMDVSPKSKKQGQQLEQQEAVPKGTQGFGATISEFFSFGRATTEPVNMQAAAAAAGGGGGDELMSSFRQEKQPRLKTREAAVKHETLNSLLSQEKALRRKEKELKQKEKAIKHNDALLSQEKALQKEKELKLKEKAAITHDEVPLDEVEADVALPTIAKENDVPLDEADDELLLPARGGGANSENARNGKIKAAKQRLRRHRQQQAQQDDDPGTTPVRSKKIVADMLTTTTPDAAPFGSSFFDRTSPSSSSRGGTATTTCAAEPPKQPVVVSSALSRENTLFGVTVQHQRPESLETQEPPSLKEHPLRIHLGQSYDSAGTSREEEIEVSFEDADRQLPDALMTTTTIHPAARKQVQHAFLEQRESMPSYDEMDDERMVGARCPSYDEMDDIGMVSGVSRSFDLHAAPTDETRGDRNVSSIANSAHKDFSDQSLLVSSSYYEEEDPTFEENIQAAPRDEQRVGQVGSPTLVKQFHMMSNERKVPSVLRAPSFEDRAPSFEEEEDFHVAAPIDQLSRIAPVPSSYSEKFSMPMKTPSYEESLHAVPTDELHMASDHDGFATHSPTLTRRANTESVCVAPSTATKWSKAGTNASNAISVVDLTETTTVSEDGSGDERPLLDLSSKHQDTNAGGDDSSGTSSGLFGPGVRRPLLSHEEGFSSSDDTPMIANGGGTGFPRRGLGPSIGCRTSKILGEDGARDYSNKVQAKQRRRRQQQLKSKYEKARRSKKAAAKEDNSLLPPLVVDQEQLQFIGVKALMSVCNGIGSLFLSSAELASPAKSRIQAGEQYKRLSSDKGRRRKKQQKPSPARSRDGSRGRALAVGPSSSGFTETPLEENTPYFAEALKRSVEAEGSHFLSETVKQQIAKIEAGLGADDTANPIVSSRESEIQQSPQSGKVAEPTELSKDPSFKKASQKNGNTRKPPRSLLPIEDEIAEEMESVTSEDSAPHSLESASGEMGNQNSALASGPPNADLSSTPQPPGGVRMESQLAATTQGRDTPQSEFQSTDVADWLSTPRPSGQMWIEDDPTITAETTDRLLVSSLPESKGATTEPDTIGSGDSTCQHSASPEEEDVFFGVWTEEGSTRSASVDRPALVAADHQESQSATWPQGEVNSALPSDAFDDNRWTQNDFAADVDAGNLAISKRPEQTKSLSVAERSQSAIEPDSVDNVALPSSSSIGGWAEDQFPEISHAENRRASQVASDLLSVDDRELTLPCSSPADFVAKWTEHSFADTTDADQQSISEASEPSDAQHSGVADLVDDSGPSPVLSLPSPDCVGTADKATEAAPVEATAEASAQCESRSPVEPKSLGEFALSRMVCADSQSNEDVSEGSEPQNAEEPGNNDDALPLETPEMLDLDRLVAETSEPADISAPSRSSTLTWIETVLSVSAEAMKEYVAEAVPPRIKAENTKKVDKPEWSLAREIQKQSKKKVSKLKKKKKKKPPVETTESLSNQARQGGGAVSKLPHSDLTLDEPPLLRRITVPVDMDDSFGPHFLPKAEMSETPPGSPADGFPMTTFLESRMTGENTPTMVDGERKLSTSDPGDSEVSTEELLTSLDDMVKDLDGLASARRIERSFTVDDSRCSADTSFSEPIVVGKPSAVESIVGESALTEQDALDAASPALIDALDTDTGIPKGDIMISLLINEQKGSPSWTNRVDEAVWRCRNLRRHTESGRLAEGGRGTPAGRPSVCVDVDDFRVIGGIDKVRDTQNAAIEHLDCGDEDDLDEAQFLLEDVLYSYESFERQMLQLRKTKALGFQSERFAGCVATAHYNLGIAHLLQGQHEEAFAYFERATLLRADCPHVGIGHVDHIAALVKSGMCRFALEDYSMAYLELSEAVTFAREEIRTLPDLRQLSEILNNLGCLCYFGGEVDKARHFFFESLKIQDLVANHSIYLGSERACHSASLNMSITRANVGFLSLVTRSVSESISIFESAMKDQQLLLRGSNVTLISTMEHLVVANLLDGRKLQALQLLKRVFGMQLQSFGKDDERCLCTENKIAMLERGDSGSVLELDAAVVEGMVESIPVLDETQDIPDVLKLLRETRPNPNFQFI